MVGVIFFLFKSTCCHCTSRTLCIDIFLVDRTPRSEMFPLFRFVATGSHFSGRTFQRRLLPTRPRFRCRFGSIKIEFFFILPESCFQASKSTYPSQSFCMAWQENPFFSRNVFDFARYFLHNESVRRAHYQSQLSSLNIVLFDRPVRHVSQEICCV